MSNRFSDYTTRIQNKLPYWFDKMKTDKSSIGAEFLNVFGLTLEDINTMLTYAYEQTNLNTIDTNQVAKIYKAFVAPVMKDTYHYSIKTDQFILTKIDDLGVFLEPEDDDEHNEINFKNYFLVDIQKHLIYVRFAYDADEIFQYGRISVEITDGDKVILDEVLKLIVHPVWNFFDEFGLLLLTPRLPDETNADYKTRLLDVFKHPSGTHMVGLLNGIARDLGLRKVSTWYDGQYDFVIPDNMVIVNSIELDNVSIDQDLVTKSAVTSKITLKGSPAYEGVSRDVSWAYGFTMHQLHNKEDRVLQTQIDTPGKPMLQYIVDTINKEAPVIWGHFIWDESYWDIGDGILGRTPTRLDGLYGG